LEIDPRVLRNPDLLRDELVTEGKEGRLGFVGETDGVEKAPSRETPGAPLISHTEEGMAVDVHAHGRRIGRLFLSWLAEDQVGPAREKEVLGMVDGASQTLAGAILYREMVWEGGIQDTMQKIVSLITSAGDVRDILSVVCQEGAQVLKADAAVIWLLEGDNPWLRRYACCNASESETKGEDEAWSWQKGVSTPVDRVLGRNCPEAFELPQNPQLAELFGRGDDWDGYGALFPIQGRDGVLGVMALCRGGTTAFSEDTMAKAQLLAMHAGMALQDAFLIEELSDTNAQLRQTQREKIQSEKLAAVGKMSASIAHEIRNPLGAISNCLRILSSPDSGERSRDRALRLLEQEFQRLDRTAKEFLDFARPQAEARRAMDPGALVASLEEEMSAHLAEQEVSVSLFVELEPDLPECPMEPDRIRQALWNLFLNALKASEGTTGKIGLRVGREADWLRFSVTDTGMGIEGEERAEIFEPFFTTKASGSGLGLAIVKQIAESHGGWVDMDSQPGAGTEFTLVLPLSGENHEPKPAANRQCHA
jgi:hypothetical protein